MLIYKLILIISVCFSIAGSYMLKFAMKQIGFVEINKEIFFKIFIILKNPYIWVAIIISSLSFLSYAIVLSKMELSKALPISIILVTIVVFVISIIFLNESIEFKKILGIIICLVGVFLLFY